MIRNDELVDFVLWFEPLTERIDADSVADVGDLGIKGEQSCGLGADEEVRRGA